jgi:hypothetical protein
VKSARQVRITDLDQPDITSADISFSATGKAVCPNGMTNGYGTATINWNNGASSTWQGSFIVTPGNFGFSGGTITSGLFKGSAMTLSGYPTENWAACFWGLTSGEAIVSFSAISPALGTS